MEFLEAKLSKTKYFGTWSHCCIDGWARRRSWWLSAENWSWIWLGACNKNVVRNASKRESQKGRVKKIELTVVKVPIGGGKPGTDMVVRGVTLYVGSLCGDPARWWDGWVGAIHLRFSSQISKVTCRCRLCLITTCCGAGGESECGESTGEWSCQWEVVRASHIENE